ncbi:MAG: hypothetical protein IAI50_12905 [Candidatus Eremiobacteraeota bacterium]|nr:hypothetical protein [Candidatus Eremiobacteraeota bacterium]
MTVEATPIRRGGLKIVWDVIVAPGEAFVALRERPQWGWAFLVVCVLGIAGALLQIPAGEHIIAATLMQNAAHDPNLAAMPPDQRAHIVSQAQTVQRFSWVFLPAIAMFSILVAASIMLVGNAVARGSGRFVQFFSLAANVAVINFGIGSLLIGVLVALRGPDAFTTQRDIFTALPSLAWLAPGASPKLGTFLSTFNPFQIWSCVLIATALGSIANIGRVLAYIIAAIVSFGGVLFAVPLAK